MSLLFSYYRAGVREPSIYEDAKLCVIEFNFTYSEYASSGTEFNRIECIGGFVSIKHDTRKCFLRFRFRSIFWGNSKTTLNKSHRSGGGESRHKMFDEASKHTAVKTCMRKGKWKLICMSISQRDDTLNVKLVSHVCFPAPSADARQ